MAVAVVYSAMSSSYVRTGSSVVVSGTMTASVPTYQAMSVKVGDGAGDFSRVNARCGFGATFAGALPAVQAPVGTPVKVEYQANDGSGFIDSGGVRVVQTDSFTVS